jgi:hypothetical protein
VDAVETVCPLCDRPRPRGAKRCVCNYTFEYDQSSTGGFARSRGRSAAGLVPALVAIAVVAAVGGAWYMHTALASETETHGQVGLLLVPAGVFAVAGAVFDWSWFFRARKARLIALVFTRTGARVIYAALGGALAGGGCAMLLA